MFDFSCDGNLQLGFMLIALIWKFDFSPFMILVIAILNDGELTYQAMHANPSNDAIVKLN
jgi:hypothetical protein